MSRKEENLLRMVSALGEDRETSKRRGRGVSDRGCGLRRVTLEAAARCSPGGKEVPSTQGPPGGASEYGFESPKLWSGRKWLIGFRPWRLQKVGAG